MCWLEGMYLEKKRWHGWRLWLKFRKKVGSIRWGGYDEVERQGELLGARERENVYRHHDLGSKQAAIAGGKSYS